MMSGVLAVNRFRYLALSVLVVAITGVGNVNAADLPPGLSFESGPVNVVVLDSGDEKLAVYNAGNQSVDRLLLTHHRRDVIWPARLVDEQCRIVAPSAERDMIENPRAFWTAFESKRFHDYEQQSTKIVGVPLQVDRWISGGDKIEWNGPTVTVIETPGYTRGSVSYLATIDGKRIAFTGDLIYGDGQIIDLYSFQDAIEEANIRGYHGYGGRLGQLVQSLRKLAAQNPDLIVPARGPLIEDPQTAIATLIDRVQAVYAGYLSTSALHWYFKEDRMRACGARVLDAESPIDLMPYSLHEPAPDWVFEQATSRLLISDSGHAFLLDCGYQRVIDAVDKLMKQRIVTKVDGIFVTHFHDDHTDMVQAAAEHFECPVYAVEQYVDVLQHPDRYHLPAMTSTSISPVRAMSDGETMAWREFQLTFHFFPGQTFYHGGLMVRRQEERPVFFIGDAFAPSGIDDYCVLNRNLLHADSGYQLCFQKLRAIGEPFWLVNEHIPFVFEFNADEMSYLESRYRDRIKVLSELFPWDDPNYGIDEQWVRFYPYGVKAKPGESVKLQVRVDNHSPRTRTFRLSPHVSAGGDLSPARHELSLDSRESGSIAFEVRAPDDVGTHLVTVDVESDGISLREWTEAMITVTP